MALLQNVAVIFSVFSVILTFCSKSFAVPTGIADVLKVNDTSYIIMVSLQPNSSAIANDGGGTAGKRVKRQEGGGKFADSARMSQTKLMQVYLQMFKNLVAGNSIGGGHPMHPDTVKPVVKLFKYRIIEFFFPEV